MKNYYILDCETKALPKEKLMEIAPEFDADRRLTDPAKIKTSREAKEAEWLESAALDSHRSTVLAIGVTSVSDGAPEPYILWHGHNEKDLLTLLRDYVTEFSDCRVVGHYLLGFDIPLLVRRFWLHGIKPPTQWLDCTPWRATWAFDTAHVWSCGNRDQRIKLDVLAWHLGVGRKNGDGKDFAALYETDQEKALEYLRNDLRLTEGCYLKMR
jgi:hypothetical protein